MKNKIILTGLFLSLGATASEGRVLNCGFTEPFYDVTLNLDTGRLEQHDINWESPESEMIVTVLDENSRVELIPQNKVLKILAKSSVDGRVLLEGTLNYKGSDGMSEMLYPVEVKHDREGYGLQHGGCSLGNLSAYDTYQLSIEDENLLVFAEHAGAAISLCMNRAVADWTVEASTYNPLMTKFSVLYGSDVVPGEPGDVSSTFSSAENEALYQSLELAKTPAQDGSSLNALRSAMWEYCSLYGTFLQTRFVR